MNISLPIPAALVTAAALAVTLDAPVARASDEGNDVAVKVEAALEAAACTGSPATVTLLGLNIDVTKAKFEADDDGDDDDDVPNPAACAELSTGARVEAKLVDDLDPLTAIEVEQEGDDDEDGPELQAPLQAVDPASGQITLLGLSIDASAADLEGEDDDCDEDGGHALDLSQLALGQLVEVHLDESRLPALVASRLEVKNFTNQIEIDLEDEHGEDIDDDSPTVKAEAAVTVLVKIPARKGQRARVVRQTVRVNQTAAGRFTLSGLPKGVAKIQIVRELDGVKWAARRSVKVLPDNTRTVRVRLRRTRAQ